MTKLLDVASKAKVGNPMLPDTNVGPVATKPQFEKVLGYIDIGKSEGAKCVLGGDVFRGRWFTRRANGSTHNFYRMQ